MQYLACPVLQEIQLPIDETKRLTVVGKTCAETDGLALVLALQQAAPTDSSGSEQSIRPDDSFALAGAVLCCQWIAVTHILDASVDGAFPNCSAMPGTQR